MVVLLLLVKEDVWLFLVPLGIYVAVRHDRKSRPGDHGARGRLVLDRLLGHPARAERGRGRLARLVEDTRSVA